LVGLDSISFSFNLKGSKLVGKDIEFSTLEDLVDLGFQKSSLLIRDCQLDNKNKIQVNLYIQGIGESLPRFIGVLASNSKGRSEFPALLKPIHYGFRLPKNIFLFVGLSITSTIWETWNNLSSTGNNPKTWNEWSNVSWDSNTPSNFEYLGSISAQRII
jgi:hypothetical protein